MSSSPLPSAPFGQKCFRLVATLIAAVLTPLPAQKIWEWLDEHVVVPLIVGSRYTGPLDTGVMPQWRGLLEKYAPARRAFLHAMQIRPRRGHAVFRHLRAPGKNQPVARPHVVDGPDAQAGRARQPTGIEAYLKACKPVKKVSIYTKTAWTCLEKRSRPACSRSSVPAA